MLGVHSKAVRPAASTGRPITRIPAFQGVGDPFTPLAAPPAAQSAHFDSIALRAESETESVQRSPRRGAPRRLWRPRPLPLFGAAASSSLYQALLTHTVTH